MSIQTISPRELHNIVCSGKQVNLIDVRTPAEFREVHVAFAINVPLNQLNAKELVNVTRDSEQPLYVICKSGARGRQACEKITAAGCRCVINVDGGTLAWEQACLPVVRGKKTISLERQVRIVAGLLIVIGSLLTIALDEPLWSILCGACGIGLMHAGLTDSCLMGMMLSVMPWNQGGPKSAEKPIETTTDSCSR
ncbi:MAG: rhodanese-like domain-containing protein [Pirellulales bacterium]